MGERWGLRVKLTLIRLGVMQKHFAARCGIGDEYLSRVLRGHVRGSRAVRQRIDTELRNLVAEARAKRGKAKDI